LAPPPVSLSPVGLGHAEDMELWTELEQFERGQKIRKTTGCANIIETDKL
jgi:hypothetical protein